MTKRKVVLPVRFEVGTPPRGGGGGRGAGPRSLWAGGGGALQGALLRQGRGPARRKETSDSRRKEQKDELLQKNPFGDGGRKAMAGEPTRRAIAAGARMLMHKAVEPEEEATPRASDVELLDGFPLLKLPEELQLLVAAHVVSSPRDRAALCFAVPPLGRKAIKEIPTYTGPLMSLGKRVLSGGAVGEAEVRRYVREIAPSGPSTRRSR